MTSFDKKEVILMVLVFLFCTFCVGACTYLKITTGNKIYG